MTDLAQLSRCLGCEEFKSMRDVPGAWDTYSGANPGTYIAYDHENQRVLFAEPSGDVGIMVYNKDDDDVDEINFNVGELAGFAGSDVLLNKSYHRSTEALRGL